MRSLILLHILLLAISVVPHLAAADPKGPCDYKTGHGFIFFSPSFSHQCNTFVIYHAAELECPHQYIVAAEVTVASDLAALYCNQINSGNETVYGVAPEFILPEFISGKITEFTTQFFQGFFANVLVESTTMSVSRFMYGQMINVVQVDRLSYLLYEDSLGNQFMTHLITTSPDFDHVITVQTDYVNNGPKSGRKGPVLVRFDVVNTYQNRLAEKTQYTGLIYGLDIAGNMGASWINVKVLRNVYPGPNRANGDGTADFAHFCVEPDRPVWDSCRGF